MLITNTPEIDLGQLKFGIPHNFKYILTNTSIHPVKIDKVALGCQSCTAAAVDRNDVAPGDSVHVRVTFTPGSTGVNMKRITIYYKLNSAPLELVLKFKAKVNG